MSKYTKEELIKSLKRAEENIIPLTGDKFDKNSNYPSKKTISREFGSWSDACEEVDVESGQVTQKSILHNIKSLYESGEIENSEDFFQHSETISSATFYKKFDSWREAVDKLDLEAYTHYSTDDLLEFIKKFNDVYGYVSARKFHYNHDYPASSTIINNFDSWNSAVAAAGIEPNEIGVAASEEPCGLKEKLFGSNWHTQRERALERDSFECTECGSEKNLCVHHDKPRVAYRNSSAFTIEEANKLSNLVTLCKDCHYDVHSNDVSLHTEYSSNLQPRIVQ